MIPNIVVILTIFPTFKNFHLSRCDKFVCLRIQLPRSKILHCRWLWLKIKHHELKSCWENSQLITFASIVILTEFCKEEIQIPIWNTQSLDEYWMPENVVTLMVKVFSNVFNNFCSNSSSAALSNSNLLTASLSDLVA